MKKHYYLDRIVEVCDHKHLTVDEIFTALKEEFPEVGKSSVYRNVEELSKKGELVKIKWIWNKTHFERNIWEHVHLIDTTTWKIVDIDIDDITIPWLPENFKISNKDIKVYWEFS